jgi:apocytochrome f
MIQFFQKFFLTCSFFLVFSPFQANAFPLYAQQAYENPREANGRIVCANCHLAQKPTEVEVPSAVLPNTVFESLVKIPYDKSQKQLLANGQKGGLNVGAVVLLPKGFTLAPKSRLEKTLEQKLKGLYITPYSATQDNILVVGPVSGEKFQEIPFPILSPNPEQDTTVFYLKYPIYVGANRGRGQLYPTGEKTNNNSIVATSPGTISAIEERDKETQITILRPDGNLVTQSIPKNVKILVKEKESILPEQLLTENPNVGGFGQAEAEITLQDPRRIYAYLAFCMSILLTQAMFVLKKKQFEKVQLAEMDF